MIEAIQYASSLQLAERDHHREILQRIAARAVVDNGIDLRRRFKVVVPEPPPIPVEPLPAFPPPLSELPQPPPSIPDHPPIDLTIRTPQNFMHQIQRMVASEFNVDITELTSDSRKARIIFPRHIAIYLCRTMTARSTPEIGRCFGGRDHSTIIHAVRKMDARRRTDCYVCQVLMELVDRLEKHLKRWRKISET